MTAAVYIITGASRGLGAALFTALAAPERQLVGIAREGLPAELVQQAQQKGAITEQIAADLSTASGVQTVAAALHELAIKPRTRCYLIHNAGTLDPMAFAGQWQDPTWVARSIALNVSAPMQLTDAFLRATVDIPDRRLLFISSGAAHHPYPGWSVYGASKAALDQFARTVALEQIMVQEGARVCALAPGVIDTDMQKQIRAADSQQFPQRERFVSLKQEGRLQSPAEAAQRVAAWLHHAAFGETAVLDLRDIMLSTASALE